MAQLVSAELHHSRGIFRLDLLALIRGRVTPLTSPGLTIVSSSQHLPQVIRLLPRKSWFAEIWFVSHQQQFTALLKSPTSGGLVMQLFQV